jgi:hypothetical protein
VESHGWQVTFTVIIVPSLFIAGLVTLFQPNLRSGIEIE